MSASNKPFSRWRPHPWHGLSSGEEAPQVVNAYIEITPFDIMKYEVDKTSGYLRIDRPQIGSSLPPCSYGFIPQTYCAEKVTAYSKQVSKADGDPLDICIISEMPINRAEVLVKAKVVGGFRMIDNGEADDKIIAVLSNDALWGETDSLARLPESLTDRIQHYFSTYKMNPQNDSPVEIEELYDVDQARKVIQASIEDYQNHFGDKNS
ncbi:MAG: inorganic pyrophosphatase [Opitutales bacterium]|nr:inorganic pyrophosphatase [Opitutales bacterium]